MGIRKPKILKEKTEKRKIGDIGEDIVDLFLKKRGYIIIERNYLKPWGEIDIVAKQGDILHFVEVKTVSCEIREGIVSRETVRPEENMHGHKIRRLDRAIQTYLTERRISRETPFQLDLVTVRIDKVSREYRTELFENVF